MTWQRVRELADLHFYQKWRAGWPVLARLSNDGVRLLDAGCGDGQWSLEIAQRRPHWTIVGVDRDGVAIERAIARAKALHLTNVSFEQSDFAAFRPSGLFDVVLSVCSSHYGPTRQATEALFRQLGAWMAPTGRLLMIAPRHVREVPFVSGLQRPAWHEVFTRDELVGLCQASELAPTLVAPKVGRVGTMAKQLDWSRLGLHPIVRGAVGLLARTIGIVDAHIPGSGRSSLMWVLVAQRK